MRYLILGKNGMLGRALQKAFHDTDFIAFDRSDLDISNYEQMKAKIVGVEPDVVINATGYTNVELAESEEEKANLVNGYAVGYMAKVCRDYDITLVHFSTDYVFDGTRKAGYDEDARTVPLNAYGRSKALGEKLIEDEMNALSADYDRESRYFIIRTSWLFGHSGKNFVSTMLKLSETKKELKVVNDQHGKPTYANDLAQQTKFLLESREYPAGIYHITNEGVTTWYKFAREIFRLAKININVVACASSEYPTVAVRPKYSALHNNKLPMLRNWKEALGDFLKDTE